MCFNKTGHRCSTDGMPCSPTETANVATIALARLQMLSAGRIQLDLKHRSTDVIDGLHLNRSSECCRIFC